MAEARLVGETRHLYCDVACGYSAGAPLALKMFVHNLRSTEVEGW